MNDQDNLLIKSKANLGLISNISIERRDSRKRRIDINYYHNLVVTAGMKNILYRLSGERTNLFYIDKIDLGYMTNPPAVTLSDTNLSAGANSRVSYKVTSVYSEDITSGSSTINSVTTKLYIGINEEAHTYTELGLFSNYTSSNGVTMIAKVIPATPIEKTLGTSLIITWNLGLANVAT